MADNAVVRRLRALDPEHYGLQRGVRTAIAATVMLVFGLWVGNSQIALIGVFGAVATLLFVEFPGNRQARWAGYAMLGIFGLVLICLGTLASANIVLSVVGMAVFGFAILFAGVLSAGAAAASRAAILLFLLPVMVPGPPSDILPRLVGWIVGWAVSVSLSMFLWPRRDFDNLRAAVSRACRATAQAISAPSASDDPARLDDVQQASLDAMTDLRDAFRASTSRPVGLSAGGRLLGRTIHDLESLFIDPRDIDGAPRQVMGVAPREIAAVGGASAEVLDAAAEALDRPVEPNLGKLEASIATLGTVRQQALSAWLGAVLEGQVQAGEATGRLHGLAYSTDQVARHVAASIDADARPALDKLLGRGTTVVAASPISAIERLTRYHMSWRSVWFHNSLRGALGLALAVLVAQLLDVQHGFWVGLGTLSVLRSTASNTGYTALRAVLGTALGVIVSAPILILLGNGPGLWVALPIGMFLAGFATAAMPLAVGQGAFSAAVLVLFALLDPAGPPVGLIRVEDVAIGGLAGVVVGLLLWPRGAAAEIRRATAEAYRAGARLLDHAVVRITAPTDDPEARSDPVDLAEVRGSALRLDDALRQYLADRGGKSGRVDDLVLVCVGADRLRLSGEAIAELGHAPRHNTAPPAELSTLMRRRTTELTQWQTRLADALEGGSGEQSDAVPDPPPADLETQVLAWVNRHPHEARAALTATPGPRSATATTADSVDTADTPSSLVWATIHLDHVARIQVRVRSRIEGILPHPTQAPRSTQVSPVAG